MQFLHRLWPVMTMRARMTQELAELEAENERLMRWIALSKRNRSLRMKADALEPRDEGRKS